MAEDDNNGLKLFISPCKSLRGGLKAMNINAEVNINDELALRKAEEAALRRFQAVEWLRQMDHGASEVLSIEPSEVEFCLALRNGLILCNVLNKVNPGSVLKVVENPVIDVQSTDGSAQSAIQYFENMRNFLMTVGEMKLLTFEASDLEKGGSSNKVVDCILCLKGYHEWKQAGGIGVWKYGGTVRITSSIKGTACSFVCGDSGESVDEILANPVSSYEQLLDLSSQISLEEFKIANALSLVFDRFGLGLLRTYLTELNGLQDLPLNPTLVDIVLGKVLKELSAMLVSKSSQLALILKEMLKGRSSPHSKKEFIEAVSSYLHQKSFESSTGCQKCSKVYFYGEKHGEKCLNEKASHLEKLELQEKQLKGLKSGFIETKLKIQQNQLKWEEELRKLEHHIQGLELAASSYHKVLEENRLLYNQVQDLKGSIRVYCRVRPFLPGQSVGQSIVDYIGENGNIMIANPHKQGKGARRVFSFNKVLGTNVTQEEVFADARPLIRSVLDGYNVCIFAYGQTGSGKTYTMSGPDLTTKETWGVNYRSLSDLFQLSKARESTISYDISVQMIEIYNEQVRDLLVSDGSNRRLDIRNNSQQNGLNVPDASLVSVCCTKDVLDLMRIGQKNRAVGATALNVRSSRSHSVLTVHVHGKELVSGSILRGCLHLVDLAGSERVDKSEAVGERLKEAQHINRSLSALGDVIAALAQKSAHIPYRNSKLTQVLQDSLGGHAKALMFVHINSEVNALGETISTLKFAERVASIELGAACANKESGEITELKEEISKLKAAVENKEAELEQLKGVSFCGISQEVKKAMTISPLQRFSGASLRPEINQRPLDEAKNIVVRSISSGKQRGSRFPFGTPDKQFDSKSAFISNTRFVDSMKSRSPSPPVRRSISTDRGTLIRSNKSKLETLDEQPEVKLYIPSKTAINKSVASNPILSINENPKGPSSQEVVAQNGKISDMLYHQRARSRKVYPEQEEDQFKVALNVRQGGIRKSKPESTKTKFKYQLPTRIHKSDAGETWQSEVETGGKVEEPRKSHFSEAEKGTGLLEESPIFNSLRVKKVLHNFSRISPNIEQRVSTQEVVEGKHENKLLNGVTTHQGKEGRHVPDFRQSRSSPRGSPNI